MSVSATGELVSTGRDAPENEKDTPGLTVRTVQRAADDDPAVIIIVVTGELDRAGAPSLRSAWDAGSAFPPAQVVLDLRRVDGCDAAGLDVLADLSAACRARGGRLQMWTRGRLEWLLLLAGLAQDAPSGGAPDPSPHGTPATVR